MLLEDDDLPLHQTPLPLAHAMGGHPNAYDRFFFNAYREDLYVAVAMGLYPNRGVIDAAIGVLRHGVADRARAAPHVPDARGGLPPPDLRARALPR